MAWDNSQNKNVDEEIPILTLKTKYPYCKRWGYFFYDTDMYTDFKQTLP